MLFNESTPQDIVIFTAGMSYAGAKLSGHPLSHLLDSTGWLRSSASAFRAHLAATFPGQVFRVTMAQFKDHLAGYSHFLRQADQLLWGVFRPGSEEGRERWYTIDQWAINENRERMYNDHVHYVGKLTHATLQQVLNLLCPMKS